MNAVMSEIELNRWRIRLMSLCCQRVKEFWHRNHQHSIVVGSPSQDLCNPSHLELSQSYADAIQAFQTRWLSVDLSCWRSFQEMLGCLKCHKKAMNKMMKNKWTFNQQKWKIVFLFFFLMSEIEQEFFINGYDNMYNLLFSLKTEVFLFSQGMSPILSELSNSFLDRRGVRSSCLQEKRDVGDLAAKRFTRSD